MVTAARRLLAAVLATAVVPVAACTPTASPPQPTATCLQPPDHPAAEQSDLTAPDGGQLRVTEQGFSRLPGHPFVLIGAMIENPSGHVAYDTTVTVTLHAADGTIVNDPYADQQRQVTIPIILPGTQIGYAASIGHMSTLTGEVIPPASITIHIGPSRWLPADGPTFAGPTVADVTTSIQGDDGGTPFGGITFTLSSGYCRDVTNAGVATIFRDTTGTIVGGSFDAYIGPCPAQARTVHLGIRLPPNADPEKSTPYPYCNPIPPT
jgi:hypothetical protein